MKKIPRLLAASVAALSLIATSLVWASPLGKVVICHATGSESNPYVKIVVSSNALSGHFNNNGSPVNGHEDDILMGETEHDGDEFTCPTGGGDGGGGGGCVVPAGLTG